MSYDLFLFFLDTEACYYFLLKVNSVVQAQLI